MERLYLKKSISGQKKESIKNKHHPGIGSDKKKQKIIKILENRLNKHKITMGKKMTKHICTHHSRSLL